MKHLVAFAGAAGSGKDSAASLYLDNLGADHETSVRPLAGPLKQISCTLATQLAVMQGSTDIVNLDLHAEKEKPRSFLAGKSYRQIMQFMGTEFGRNFLSPTIWLDLWASQLINPCLLDLVLVPDVRFPDEVNFLQAYAAKQNAAFTLIFLTRPDNPSATTSYSHESEAYLPQLRSLANCRILNSGTLEDLSASISTIVRTHFD
jgi:hypothetical protein